jgi:hypothetical protein
MEDLGYKFFLTSRKIAPVLDIKSLRRSQSQYRSYCTYLAHPKAEAEFKNKTFFYWLSLNNNTTLFFSLF